MNSIRKRLLRWLLIGQLLAVAVAGIITFYYVRSELEELFDDRLRQLAYSVPSDGEFVQPQPRYPESLGEGDEDIVVQIWKSDGTLLLHLHRKEGSPAMAAEGFSSHWTDGTLWRSFVLRRGDRLIQVSQPLSERLEISTGVAVNAIAPVLILVLVLGVLVWVSVMRGLRPLRQLTDDLGRRRPYSLTPLTTVGLPDEVLPLVQALNNLLERLDQALDGQRKFIADAAHELRTPLAAVQLQVQLMQRAGVAEDRDEALAQIRGGVTRASHLVHQLLTLARMEPEDWQRPFVRVELAPLVKSVVADYAPAAMQRRIDLGVSREEDVAVTGDVESLRVMLGNLVDNAVRYTPEGGRIDVSLLRVGELARIEVQDSGVGIPADERPRVFARFYRRPGTRESGSGLGLAIVREVAVRHRGEVLLADSELGTGLKVIINLPVVSS